MSNLATTTVQSNKNVILSYIKYKNYAVQDLVVDFRVVVVFELVVVVFDFVVDVVVVVFDLVVDAVSRLLTGAVLITE